MTARCVECGEESYVVLDGVELCEDCFDDALRQKGIRS